MGHVLLALDERLQKRVALKVLPPVAADDEARARFLREARALARVEHPAVVRVLASGEDDGVAWMALEYIEGDALTALSAGEPIEEETAVALMAQVARGLAAVHAVGVVHRDVKPDNLLVDAEAQVRIVDFGVALLSDGPGAGGSGGFTTRAGVVVGTPHFMSPEQARGAAVDARSDAWSLGATLFLLLTGRPPFWGSDDEADLEILARVVRDPVPDVGSWAPGTSPATRALLASLLAREAAARPADLAEVARALDDIAAALARGDVPGSAATPASTTPPLAGAASPSSSTSAPDAPSTASSTPGGGVGVVAGAVVVGVVVLGAVAGGVLLGRWLQPPEVKERVVERIVEVPVPVALPPPASPAPPAPPAAVVETPESLVHSLETTRADERAAAVVRVVERGDDVGRAALLLAAGAAGPVGDVVVEQVLFDDRVDSGALLDAALRVPSRDRGLLVVRRLAARRDDSAFLRLRGIAETHHDAAVRRAAAAARDSIFSASDEVP
jgi:hypothetical protein